MYIFSIKKKKVYIRMVGAIRQGFNRGIWLFCWTQKEKFAKLRICKWGNCGKTNPQNYGFANPQKQNAETQIRKITETRIRKINVIQGRKIARTSKTIDWYLTKLRPDNLLIRWLIPDLSDTWYLTCEIHDTWLVRYMIPDMCDAWYLTG